MFFPHGPLPSLFRFTTPCPLPPFPRFPVCMRWLFSRRYERTADCPSWIVSTVSMTDSSRPIELMIFGRSKWCRRSPIRTGGIPSPWSMTIILRCRHTIHTGIVSTCTWWCPYLTWKLRKNLIRVILPNGHPRQVSHPRYFWVFGRVKLLITKMHFALCKEQQHSQKQEFFVIMV
jgi:hypothetical protein